MKSFVFSLFILALSFFGASSLAREKDGSRSETGNNEPVFDWEPLGLGGGGAMYAPGIAAADPDRLMVNCDMGGAYRSEDGGRSWEMIPPIHRLCMSLPSAAAHGRGQSSTP